MTAKTAQGTIKDIKVVHRKSLTTLEGRQRYARIVVWATTMRGKRVWLRTVEGGLDPLFIEIKVAMAQKFFSKLVGHKIRFHEDDPDGERIFFAEEESLPKKFRVSYQDIKRAMWKWVQANHTEELNRLREEKSAKARATRKENVEAKEARRKELVAELGLRENASWEVIRRAEKAAWEKQQEERRVQEAIRRREQLEERRRNALHLSFRLGRNPKHGNEQWEARYSGRLYILRREDKYDISEGTVPVEAVFPLVPDRIILVQRI